jgi:hypothetical protein
LSAHRVKLGVWVRRDLKNRLDDLVKGEKVDTWGAQRKIVEAALEAYLSSANNNMQQIRNKNLPRYWQELHNITKELRSICTRCQLCEVRDAIRKVRLHSGDKRTVISWHKRLEKAGFLKLTGTLFEPIQPDPYERLKSRARPNRRRFGEESIGL